MIEEILPPFVSSFDCRVDLDEMLFPEEEAAIQRAVEKRQREFRTARGCARRALAVLGIDREPMVPGRAGAPPWPRGVVGSMTHCEGYRAAAVAAVDRGVTIGIDGEVDAPLPEGVLGLVASASELDMLARLPHPGRSWGRLIFSAKESIYKAWFPVTGCWLGFHDVELTIDPSGAFTALLTLAQAKRPAAAPTEFAGQWLVASGVVLSSVVLTVPVQASGAKERLGASGVLLGPEERPVR